MSKSDRITSAERTRRKIERQSKAQRVRRADAIEIMLAASEPDHPGHPATCGRRCCNSEPQRSGVEVEQ